MTTVVNAMAEGKRESSFAALRLCHAKSLEDISELKKLRESVGKNILEASMLVDSHERDLTNHCENLRRTRQNFSAFERKLSNSNTRKENKRYQDENFYVSFSSGEEGSVISSRNRRPSGYNSDNMRRQYSDAQSLSSASSYSPKEHRRKVIWKQISVPIYEDSIDSGVHLPADSHRESLDPLASDDEKTQNVHRRSHRANSPTALSDRSSTISCNIREPSLAPGGATRYQRNERSRFILSNTWRSTPNILECQVAEGARRPCSFANESVYSQPVSFNKTTLLESRETRTVPKRSDWHSLPDLASARKKDNRGKEDHRKKKRRGFFQMLRKLTKSGEYVLKDDVGEQTNRQRKGHSKKDVLRSSRKVGAPTSISPLGKTVEVIDGRERLYRAVVNMPSNGLYGFYIQQGFKKIKKGVFVGSFVNSQTEKLFSGILRRGDEIIQMNTLIDHQLTLTKAMEVLSSAETLDLTLLPYTHRTK